jgi:hypothetical protein
MNRSTRSVVSIVTGSAQLVDGRVLGEPVPDVGVEELLDQIQEPQPTRAVHRPGMRLRTWWPYRASTRIPAK